MKGGSGMNPEDQIILQVERCSRSPLPRRRVKSFSRKSAAEAERTSEAGSSLRDLNHVSQHPRLSLVSLVRCCRARSKRSSLFTGRSEHHYRNTVPR
ncbi:hypothetical protein FQA47_016131 [Oryzias melastigma]|uniref:Uncharacterized protein n=1 Tax=Oryzias melastigma TaxID=30732 RepID=A0A834FSI7_ORYME|nr:hypothetical protein FQA47_016131 [Oryzias melastigma]